MSSKKRTRRSFSLAAQLATWYTAATFAFTLFVGATLYWGLEAADAAHRAFTQEEDLTLADKVHVVRRILAERPDPTGELAREVKPVDPGDPAAVYVRLLDENRVPRLTTPGMDALVPRTAFTVIVPADVDVSRGMDIRPVHDRSFRAMAARAVRPGSDLNRTWLVQVAVDRGRHETLLAEYTWGIAGILAVTVIACPLIAYRIARRGLRPVHRIGETARRIGSATLSARIDSAGYPVELGALADAFNGMLDRLDDAFGRLSQFSADIAHELRTPIHNMRGEAEVALSRTRSADEYKEALTSCLEESVRLSDLIERLLFLARAERPATHLQREPVRVARELEAVRDYYAPAAAEARVNLAVESEPEVMIAADRGLLQGAISNLVANALAHTPPGGTITLGAQAVDGHVRIEVRDTGSGIPAEDLARVFDRFYRADRSRSSGPGSVGLGLAIVKGIVVAHGGKAEVESEVGKGTRIALIIPGASVPPAGDAVRLL